MYPSFIDVGKQSFICIGYNRPFLFPLQDEDGNALSDKEIRAEVVTFFSAGQDTVAAGSNKFILYLFLTELS